MSRGRGRIERTLLAVLDRQAEPVDTYKLAALVYDVPADPDGIVQLTAAQISSVRRALGNLGRSKLAFDCGRRHAINRTHWAGERVGLRYVIRRARTLAAIGQPEPVDIALLVERAGELGVDLS